MDKALKIRMYLKLRNPKNNKRGLEMNLLELELLMVYCFFVLVLFLSSSVSVLAIGRPDIRQPYQIQNLKSSKVIPKIAIQSKKQP